MNNKIKVKALLSVLMSVGVLSGVSKFSIAHGMKRSAPDKKPLVAPYVAEYGNVNNGMSMAFLSRDQVAVHAEWFRLLKSGHLDRINSFLSVHGKACLNWFSVNGVSTLNYAIFESSYRVVEYLLEIGADVNSDDMTGRNPLLCAVLRILEADSVSINDKKVLEAVLDCDPDINMALDGGNTVLHFVAESGKLGLYKGLVRRGAREDIANYEGLTPKDISRYCYGTKG